MTRITNYKNLTSLSKAKWEKNYQNNRFFLKWPDIKNLFRKFKKINIGYNEFSFDLKYRRCHWIISAKK